MNHVQNLKNITLALLLAAILSAGAFTQTVFAESVTPLVTKSPSQETSTILVSGIITEIKDAQDYTTIIIDNQEMGMVFHAKKNVFVIDQKTNTLVQLSEMKLGMAITAVLDKNSPMTLSIPGQTSGAIGFVINSSPGFINLSVYDDQLVNAENTIKLTISDKTQLVSYVGTKQILSEKDLNNSECLVLYTISTKSIPAQTTPEMVMIIKTTADENEYVGLREQAEAKGYLVSWDAKSKSIILSKDDAKLVLKLGSKGFTYSHQTKDVRPLDRIQELSAPVMLTNGKTMVPQGLINTL